MTLSSCCACFTGARCNILLFTTTTDTKSCITTIVLFQIRDYFGSWDKKTCIKWTSEVANARIEKREREI